MLAHELRNPLAAIDNAVSLLGFPDPGRDNIEWSVDVIGRHVKHLTRLIDDLLDVSRITRGKIQLRKMKIDACPVLEQCDRVGPSVARGTTAPADHVLRDGPHPRCRPDPTGTDRR